MGWRLLLVLISLSGAAFAQLTPAAAARNWREMHERSILDEFFDLLRIPNSGQDPASLRRNAEEVAASFERRGVTTQLLEFGDRPPVVFGELKVRNASQTLVFCANYDGAPVLPSDWSTGDPYRPTLMSGRLEEGGQPIPLPRPGWPTDPEWRIYARSAADNKAAIISLAVALEALRNRQTPIRSNLKFFFSGSAEQGWPGLERILERHRNMLRGDAWIFCGHQLDETRRARVIFGVRGIAGLDLTVYGPRRPLDSGHYGGWAPNPALMLARLLSTMKDEDGGVLIDGFYDAAVPLSDAERRAIAEIPDFDATLRREFWLAGPVAGGLRLEEAINRPALNIRALAAGESDDDRRNFIPASAHASLDIRLVKGMDHQRVVELVADHVRRQGFFVTESEPGEEVRLAHPRVCKITRRRAYNAVRTPMDLDICRRIVAAAERANGPVTKIPTLGASLPLEAYEQILDAKVIMIPLANHDSNRGSHNENLRLQNLWDGIETLAEVMAMDGPEPAGAVSRNGD